MHLRDPWRRWLVTTIMLFAWCGITPLLLAIGYYALTAHTDFDTLISELHRDTSQPMVWAVRVGSASSYQGSIGIVSSSFGFNADDPAPAIKLPTEAEITGRYKATYLAKFRGSTFPTVLTAHRVATSNGGAFYATQVNGLRPVWSYLEFLAVFAVIGVLFFESVAYSKRKQKPGIPGSVTQP